MYHPSKYQEHNDSLDRFVRKFNEVSKKRNGQILIEIHKQENFIDDAIIKDEKTGKSISFDWEKRESYYSSCGFPFKTFGQFERKIIKPKILLSIQCSKSEDCFCIAWHSDFKKEGIENIGSITETGNYEYYGKRFTKEFKEIKYDDMELLYNILRKAFDENKLNKDSFL